MVTGNTRRYSQSLEKIKKVIPPRNGEIMFGLNMMVSKGKTVFIGDTSVNEYPSSLELADIARNAGVENLGLRSLTAIFLDQKISKKEQVSNWSKNKLTQSQKKYAATDAWLSRELYLIFQKEGMISA